MEHDQIAALLREHGLKATRPRLLVYSELESAGGHHTADDIMTMLAARGNSLPRASVYNVLENLTGADLVQIADRGAGPTVYEIATEKHHHFVCRSCGSVRDVPCVDATGLCVDVGVKGLAVDEAQIIFRGLCDECAKKIEDQQGSAVSRKD